MVLLTITETLLEAIEAAQGLESTTFSRQDGVTRQVDEESKTGQDSAAAAVVAEDEVAEVTATSRADLAIGDSISHEKILELWRTLQPLKEPKYSLESLLYKSQVYIPPPAPKPEPTSEYKALMARLRRDEEARAYERMISPPAPTETFSSRFPSASRYASVNAPISTADLGDDEVTYNEVNRQVMLIINFLVSIAGVAGTLWMVSRWWSVPARMFLVMGGSILVAVAEVSVYSAYVWKMEEGKKKEGNVKEVKEVLQTWLVGENKDDEDEGEGTASLIEEKRGRYDDNGVRKRHTVGKGTAIL